jgi:hypothetical protein
MMGRTGQVICWDRGRPSRNAPQARSLLEVSPNLFSRFALICGRDARGPGQSLERFVPAPVAEALLTVASLDYYDPFSHPNFVDWLLRKMAVKSCLEVAAVLSF